MYNDSLSWFSTVPDEMSKISKSVRPASLKYSMLSEKLAIVNFWLKKIQQQPELGEEINIKFREIETRIKNLSRESK